MSGALAPGSTALASLVEWQAAMINLGVPRVGSSSQPAPKFTCCYCRFQTIHADNRCDWCGAPTLAVEQPA